MRTLRTHHQRADDARRQSSAAPHLSISDDQLRAVYRFMYRHVGNRGDAETLTERACLEALRVARDLADDDGQSLDSLVWQTARNVATEHLRWFYGSPAYVVVDTSGGDHAGASARACDILARLPVGERDFLSRRFLANNTLDEAAAALGITGSAAQALQWRAMLQAARIAPEESSRSTC